MPAHTFRSRSAALLTLPAALLLFAGTGHAEKVAPRPLVAQAKKLARRLNKLEPAMKQHTDHATAILSRLRPAKRTWGLGLGARIGMGMTWAKGVELMVGKDPFGFRRVEAYESTKFTMFTGSLNVGVGVGSYEAPAPELLHQRLLPRKSEGARIGGGLVAGVVFDGMGEITSREDQGRRFSSLQGPLRRYESRTGGMLSLIAGADLSVGGGFTNRQLKFAYWDKRSPAHAFNAILSMQHNAEAAHDLLRGEKVDQTGLAQAKKKIESIEKQLARSGAQLERLTRDPAVLAAVFTEEETGGYIPPPH